MLDCLFIRQILQSSEDKYKHIMIAFTIPLFIFLVIFNGHVDAYPSPSSYGLITNSWHSLRTLQRPQLAKKTYYLIPTNRMNNYRPHKRLIDF